MAVVNKKIVKPAIAARTVEVAVRLCDDCGQEISYRNVCDECGADLCGKCSVTHPEDTGGDYETTICRSCRSVFYDYAAELSTIENALDDLKEKRRAACRAKRKSVANEVTQTT